ncbi:hypothetical protein BO71DRAFT_403693 [Aspergillus ellipticus CBS 707.79]|uniref:Secreted protein n=1 Tax=Aspergillus ellipticus CBS 707.79 TaxID=1448320 RepID=A0A319CVK3_9EURO|nr:hypothetical protein BO71DRAFT_403693 [Aspergillus ellipticus CBS 707.79]
MKWLVMTRPVWLCGWWVWLGQCRRDSGLLLSTVPSMSLEPTGETKPTHSSLVTAVERRGICDPLSGVWSGVIGPRGSRH